MHVYCIVLRVLLLCTYARLGLFLKQINPYQEQKRNLHVNNMNFVLKISSTIMTHVACFILSSLEL